ncbi:MAG: galactose oxidase-like domain-containing protein [Terriglobales bacterium]
MFTRKVAVNSTRKLFWILLSAVCLLGLCAETLAQSSPSSIGQWSKPRKWPELAPDAVLLPSGKVLFWAASGNGDTPQIYDPIANTFTAAPPSGFDMSSSGHAFLATGQLLVAGGSAGPKIGVPNAAIYDPVANAWTQLPNMFAGRYQPTATTLPNGDILVQGGYYDQLTGPNRLPQVWQVGPGSWRYLNGAVFGLPINNWMFVSPDGKVFNPGPYPKTYYLDPTSIGHWSLLGGTQLKVIRSYGTSVTYDVGKVLIVGGQDNPPTATAETIDLNASNPTWSATNSMANARQQLNATILPDGTVLATGGSSGSGFNNSKSPVFAAELWNPASGAWSTMASAAVYRGYGSMALLLPDGRVLTAGGSASNGEIYSPPYLFNGARPTITSAPAQVNYGQTFLVATPNAASIANVTWISLSSVTHGFNAGQRFNHLTFSQASGGLNVTAPAGPTDAPPGYYMLFILNSSGVPSVAQMIQIVAAKPVATSVNQSSGPTNGGTSVTVSGSNFLPGASVTFGGVMATNVQVTSSTTITLNTPASAAGPVNVVVTNPDYQQSTLQGGYTYTQSSGISFVQQSFTTKPKNSVPSVSAAYAVAQSAGDLNVVVIGWNDATATITSVTDSSGNTYAIAGSAMQGKALTQAIYYAKNIAAAGTGANTVTVAFNQGASYPDLRIFEYAGLDTVSPLDVANGSSGNGFTASGGSIKTNAANELVLASDTVLSKTLSPGAGYIPVLLTSFFDIAEHQITTQKGSFNPSASLDAQTNWVMQVATFKAPGQ